MAIEELRWRRCVAQQGSDFWVSERLLRAFLAGSDEDFAGGSIGLVQSNCLRAVRAENIVERNVTLVCQSMTEDIARKALLDGNCNPEEPLGSP